MDAAPAPALRRLPDFDVRASADGTLHLIGELDLSTVPVLERALAPQVGRGRRLVLDCSELRFADSAGVLAIVEAARAVGPGGSLELRSPRPTLRRVLMLLGIERLDSLEITDER